VKLAVHGTLVFTSSITYSQQSVYCTVDGAGIVPYKVTKYWHTIAFKSVGRVG